jgi:hypothetical protein
VLVKKKGGGGRDEGLREMRFGLYERPTFNHRNATWLANQEPRQRPPRRMNCKHRDACVELRPYVSMLKPLILNHRYDYFFVYKKLKKFHDTTINSIC